jgi:hypothetical protein
MNSKLKLSIENDLASRCLLPVNRGPVNRGVDSMADDAVLNILVTIQASIAALDQKVAVLDQKVGALDQKIATLDNKVDRRYAILSQDVRLIRGGVQDMVKTRVTAGEVDVLHEDMNRVQQRLENIEMLEMLEMQK